MDHLSMSLQLKQKVAEPEPTTFSYIPKRLQEAPFG